MSKIALITTTINVPKVLELYSAYGPQVKMFIAGDKKTPDEAIDFCDSLGGVNTEDAIYIGWGRQSKLGYECSELIGWNCIQRRNIALLEALKWGADIIVSIDDDNIPLSPSYFQFLEWTLGSHVATDDSPVAAWQAKFNGPQVRGVANWFDVGQLLDPVAPHRGFPVGVNPDFKVSSVVNARVGVAAGICLGDPDISAVTRIANHPTVHRVSELLQHGVVVDPGTWTVFNSQNTAFVRELAPAMFMMPGVGRYDDIYASLLTQRIMREHDYVVRFGKPFVWQDRNPHNLVADLRAEIDGMAKVQLFAEHLARIEFAEPTVLGKVSEFFEHEHPGVSLLPEQAILAGRAWCNDLERLGIG